MKTVLYILTVVFACFEASGQVRDFVRLAPEEFLLQMDISENKVVLDTRIYRDFKKSRIKGAVLAEDSNTLKAITDTLDVEQPLFVYCYTDRRSSKAAEFLIEQGFVSVFVLDGGLEAWKRCGLTLDRKRKRRKKKK